jgi:hypothetical protein
VRSTNFTRASGEIRLIKDPATRKRWNWDKIIYMSIFLVAISIGIYYLLKFMFFVYESGQVQFQALEIQQVKDIQLHKLFVNEGEKVKVGDTLFSYQIETGDEFNVLSGSLERSQNAEANLAKYISQIKVREAEVNEMRALLHFTQKERKRLEQEVHLSVYPADKLGPYIKKEEELKSTIIFGEHEIEILKNSLPSIARDTVRFGSSMPFKYFISPINGTVAHIYMTENETVLESEHIMSIFLPHKNAFIKTFFQSADMKYLHVGDQLDVVFPDGQKSVGVIRKFYQDSYELPVQYHKYSEDVYDRIEADLDPLNMADTALWNKSVKLQVEVIKYKFR